MSQVLDEILELRALVLELRGDVQRLSRLVVLNQHATPTPAPAANRNERRNELLRQLAAATGLGPTKAAALQVLLTITGTRPPPEGMADVLDELREHEPLPTAWETVYRVMTR
jgi:hypothetical protein